MLSWIREKFGKVVIGGIISFIAFVFIFSGVFNPKSTRGLHEGSVAGMVNDDAITIAEFNRELNRRMEFFRKIGNGKLVDEQLKSLKIKEGVLRSLIDRKLMIQEAKRQKLFASDEEVRKMIQEIPVFQKEGQFDFLTYKQVLQANQYTPGSFEKNVREDLVPQQWEKYFKNRVHFSEEELKKAFLLAQAKREIKYVLISTDIFKEMLRKELNLDSKAQLDSEQIKELQNRALQLAQRVSPLLKADKSSDAQVNALLQSYKIQVQTTEKMTRQNAFLPSVGDVKEIVKEIVKDAFAHQSPINPQHGGKAKVYPMEGRFVVALVSKSTQPDLSQFEREKVQLTQNLLNQKIQTIQQDWMQRVVEKSKIETNSSVVSEKE